MTLFQFTRPRGARPTWSLLSSPATLFQFTRPRGARPGALFRLRFVFGVSIHAPARGATSAVPGSGRRAERFNSRAREGRDDQRRMRRRH